MQRNENRPIRDFHGRALIIGSGWKDKIRHKETEVDDYYLIDIDETLQPDLVADFTQVLSPGILPKQRFNLILLERFPAQLDMNVFNNINMASKKDGICIIHWTDPIKRTENIFRNMDQGGFPEFLSADGTVLKGHGVYIIAKRHGALDISNFDEIMKQFLLAKQFLQRDANIVKSPENIVSRLFFAGPKSTKQASEEFEMIHLYYKLLVIDRLNNFMSSISNDDNNDIEPVIAIINAVILKLKKEEEALLPNLCSLYRDLDKISSKLPTYLKSEIIRLNDALLNSSNPPDLARRFDTAFSVFNSLHRSDIPIKQYLATAADRYLTLLEKSRKETVFWSSWFFRHKEDTDILIFAVNVFRDVLQDKKKSTELAPFHEVLMKSQIGYHFQIAKKIFHNELTTSFMPVAAGPSFKAQPMN